MERRLRYFGLTDTGKVRLNNEDAFCVKSIWGDTHLLLLVVDGCGGYEGGEIASDIALKTILHVLDLGEGLYRMEALRNAVVEANNAIHRERESKEDVSSMGCVLTAAIIDKSNDMALVAHVGDTRCYLLDNKGFRKITHDHSFVGELEEEGALTEEEAMSHPLRSVIDRMVGADLHMADDGFVDTTILSLSAEYLIMVCSDGLSDYVTSGEMEEILNSNYTTEEKCRSLVRIANRKAGKDNITVVVAEKEYEKEQ